MRLFKENTTLGIPWRKANENDIETVKKFRGAIKQNDVSSIKMMLKNNNELVRLTTVFGTFLHDAASMGNINIVDLLVNNGADINKNETLHHCRPLAVASNKGHLHIVKYLKQNGALFDYSTTLTNPLFRAIDGDHINVVKWLVDSGIDISIVYETKGFGTINAYSYAKSNRKKEICDYLYQVYKQKGIELIPHERGPWVNTVDTDFTGKPFEEVRMTILEQELSIKVPNFYKDFLIENFPKNLYFEDALDNHNWEWLGLDSLLFHTLRSLIAYNSTNPSDEKKKLLHEGYLAIGTNGAGDFYCIKLGTEDNVVYFYEHEKDQYSNTNLPINKFYEHLYD